MHPPSACVHSHLPATHTLHSYSPTHKQSDQALPFAHLLPSSSSHPKPHWTCILPPQPSSDPHSLSHSISPSSGHLPVSLSACKPPGVCNFLLATSLTLLVGRSEAGIAIAKQCSHMCLTLLLQWKFWTQLLWKLEGYLYNNRFPVFILFMHLLNLYVTQFPMLLARECNKIKNKKQQKW